MDCLSHIGCLEVTLGELVDVHGPADRQDEEHCDADYSDEFFHKWLVSFRLIIKWFQ